MWWLDLLSHYAPGIALVTASVIICFVLQATAIATLRTSVYTTTLVIAIVLDVQSGLLLWRGILSHYESLHVVMYYSRIPDTASVLVNMSQSSVYEWWILLQAIKVAVTTALGFTESFLRHIHLMPIWLFVQFHSGSLSTPLIASLIMFHFIDVIRDTVDFIYGRSNASKPRGGTGGEWTSRLAVVGLWFNWRVLFYSEMARESVMDGIVLCIPLFAQLALGIKMLVYLK